MIGRVSHLNLIGSNETTLRGDTVRLVASADPVYYHDISVTKAFHNGITVVAGLSNAFDQRPPLVSSLGIRETVVGNAPLESQYDMRGRRWFLQLRYDVD